MPTCSLSLTAQSGFIMSKLRNIKRDRASGKTSAALLFWSVEIYKQQFTNHLLMSVCVVTMLDSMASIWKKENRAEYLVNSHPTGFEKFLTQPQSTRHVPKSEWERVVTHCKAPWDGLPVYGSPLGKSLGLQSFSNPTQVLKSTSQATHCRGIRSLQH